MRPIVQLSSLIRPAVALVAAAAPVLTPAQQDAVRAEYRKLTPAEIEAHPAPALPDGAKLARIDVSARRRSASFGHKTFLAVRLESADGGADRPVEFWVEYGRSTNHPARLFGPFALPATP